ncbi:hypothetical protein [Oceanobacillus sp. FSL H7-0719]|uniref:hypothetical protein n=1 Tax=Oceanobacillus sp. FSL H7-0719 TaxID=2954507 RepID=UPI00324E862C
MGEKKQIKKQLDNELKNLVFMKQEEVLKQLTPRDWRTKVRRFWNKEITIPLLPVSSVFVLLLFGYGFFNVYDNRELEHQELIELGGSTYWKDEIEERIADED